MSKKINLIYINLFSGVILKTIKKVKLMRHTYKRWNNKMDARRKRRRKETKRKTRKHSNSKKMKKIWIKTP